jgi:ABC-type multidrug transport system ATPase subunit
MLAIKRLSEAGRTVLCTIHQPSTVLFTSCFDQLLLLKSGTRITTGSTPTPSSTFLFWVAGTPLVLLLPPL